MSRTKQPKPGARPETPKTTGEHLYLNVARVLKQEIVAGAYPVGSRLPTEEDLCMRFSVSRFTVREALRRLREDHLVASRQGAGTVVIPRANSDSYIQDVMSINDLLDFARGARFAIDTIKLVTIDSKLAIRTGLTVGEEWLAVSGTRRIDGIDVPACFTDYYINRKFAGLGRILQRHTGPIFPLIEDMLGESITEVHQEISATLISQSLAESLKVKAGTAALEIRRSYRIKNGEVAQNTINVFPASRYRHSMTLRRVRQ